MKKFTFIATMKRAKLCFMVLFTLTSSLATTVTAQYADLYNFVKLKGAEPFGSLTLAGGKLYGTAYFGGAHNDGTIFSVDTNGANYKDLYDFSKPDGMQPNAPLTIIGGLLYGSTNGGAAHDSGCIFSIDTGGTNYRDLYDFSGPDGNNVYNTLIQSGSVLFGVANAGGAHNLGCIFKIDTDGTGYKKLLDFSGATTGESPQAIILVGTKLFGTTLLGGSFGLGLVYSVDTTGLNFKDLLNFNPTPSGFEPYGGLTYSNGMLFGATAYGGTGSAGTLFSVDTSGNNPKCIYNFNGTDGAQPEYAGGSPTIIGDKYYGTTFSGGAHDSGVIFSIDTNGSNYKDLYDFKAPDGANPEGSITVGNVFYGATELDGTNNQGVVYRFDTTKIPNAINKLSVVGGQLTVYPNPNSGKFTISFSHPALDAGSQTIVEIYNSIGQKVTLETLKQVQGDNLIDLSSNPNGVYLYRVLDETRGLLGEGKIVVQK